MKKTKAFYLVVVIPLLVVSAVVFSGIAQAGEVPDGFLGVPWGASANQIIKTMNERGYRQLESESSNQLNFKGDFAGVPCLHLYFDLRAGSFYSGSAFGCAWSANHRRTQASFYGVVKELSEKYGPPQERKSGTYRGEGRECKGFVIPGEFAEWNLVDSRSDKYSIHMTLDESTYYSSTDNDKVTPCRVNFLIIYKAESLEKMLKKKEY